MTRLALAALLLFALPAAAQSAVCGPRLQIVAALAAKYGEARLGGGLQPGHGVVEIFASPGGSWTALKTLPSGIACVVAAGEAWWTDPVKAVVEGDPS